MAMETFVHQAVGMTVGELRAALAGLPDDTRIKVAVPDYRPGSRQRDPGEPSLLIDDGFTVTSVGFGTAEWGDGREETDSHLTIDIDFESGEYERETRP